MNGRLVPGESCPRRRHTSLAAAPCTPRRLKPSRRGSSRNAPVTPGQDHRAAGPVKPSWRLNGSCAPCHRVGPGRCGVTEVAWLRIASLERPRTRWRPCLAGAPHSRSAPCGRSPTPMRAPSRPGRTAGSRPDRILLAASQPTTDQADPPAVSPTDPVADSPGTLRISDPPMGALAAQGGSPAKSMSATHRR
jgi:hypothetical protein